MRTFILVVKILVPVTFFAIANISNVLISNGIAGVMTIVVIAMYAFQYAETQKS